MNDLKKISIIVLAYNEEKAISHVLDDLEKNLIPIPDYEIIVVNNGSIDQTLVKAKQKAAVNSKIRIVSISLNQGYGGGILEGLRNAKGRVVGYMSGDGQIPTYIVTDLLKKMLEENLDLAMAYRIRRQDGIWRIFISRTFHLLFNAMFGTSYRDINNNPKFFKRELLDKIMPIEHKDWFIDAEIAIKLHHYFPKAKIGQLPMEFLKRQSGKSKVGFDTILEFMNNMIKIYFKRGY